MFRSHHLIPVINRISVGLNSSVGDQISGHPEEIDQTITLHQPTDTIFHEQPIRILYKVQCGMIIGKTHPTVLTLIAPSFPSQWNVVPSISSVIAVIPFRSCAFAIFIPSRSSFLNEFYRKPDDFHFRWLEKSVIEIWKLHCFLWYSTI